ncbi:MAG: hypothetical protein ACYCZ1_02655 [Candidatus Humimicrobiaceae bacterium]
MIKLGTIIIGIILFILGILALIPSLSFASMWLAVVLLVIGIITFLLGIFNKKSA